MNNRKPIESYDVITIPHGTQVCFKFEVRQLEQEHQEAIEVLDEACTTICKLCIRLNPQHKNCTFCQELYELRKPVLKAKGE